jgi:4-hydroxy-tetrahydrodipicolinate reductase
MQEATMTRVTIVGSRGRMGQALQAVAARSDEVEVVAAVDQGDDLSGAVAEADVTVDFSSHEVTAEVARLCVVEGRGLVIGTTGHTERERAAITQRAREVAIVWSANFSTGVNTLFWLTRKAAEVLGPGYDLEVIEMHHRAKKDAPSGTARTLAEILAAVRGEQLDRVARYGRAGIPGERSASEIGIHAVRGGDVVGDHTVIFAAPGERLELGHKASNRETLASGALRAAVWVKGRGPGLYTMQDVLGLT